MLIQQRFKKRKTWSGLWDMSAGDSALMKETSYMAAEREVYEELGIQLSLKDIRLF
ncbi:NUDIX domain-containing protein [Massilimicrobiota timonensis]|uniref:NUDIX domain-containing protein n=1 Tax=Massilimicrobiota timonensis TaxID=1776392 RepID=A0ABT7UJR0_9FIRM|nr:NUDIX domain-containing protein [Massilimicrobiota timonensis]MDM8196388.1 NUDIX domain-containing protein [Massilimicrobiota timonensis]